MTKTKKQKKLFKVITHFEDHDVESQYQELDFLSKEEKSEFELGKRIFLRSNAAIRKWLPSMPKVISVEIKEKPIEKNPKAGLSLKPYKKRISRLKKTKKNLKPYGFLGWVLEFTFYDPTLDKAIRYKWTKASALAMLSNNANSLFITKMIELPGQEWETPKSVKKVKKLFETWAKKTARLSWQATVEDVPKINQNLIPLSITYWSDKYKEDTLGQIYYHEFDEKDLIRMGLDLKINYPTEKPIAIIIKGCKITKRGIE
jgi:hypothetical protein